MPGAPKPGMLSQLPIETASGQALLGGCELASSVAQPTLTAATRASDRQLPARASKDCEAVRVMSSL